MKKKLTRLFSVLLAAVLVFGTLPVAGAVDESGGNATETENAVTTVRVALNGTKTVTVDGDVTGSVGSLDTNIATVNAETSQTNPGTKYTPVTTTLEAGTYYVSATENDSAPKTEVNIEKSDDGDSYWVKSGSNYYYPTATYSSSWNRGWSDYKATKTSTKTSSSVNINASGNGFIISKEVSKNSNTTTSYLTISSNGTISGSESEAKVYFYKAEEVPSKTQTKITFNGNAVGETTVTIGDVTYKIVVVPKEVANATGLTVEFWITNQEVTANGSTSMTISAVDAYDEDGVAIESLVPATGTYSSNKMAFWKATRLLSTSKQKHLGTDMTTSGNDFTKVRYYGGKWSFYDETKKDDGTENGWVDITTTGSNSKDQIVAYYMQVTDVTKEVQTQVVDWGNIWNDSKNGLADDGQFVLVDYAVHYDGTGLTSPSTFPATKTLVYHCKHGNSAVDQDEDNGIYYRKIGQIRAVNTLPDDYEVYMITLTPNSDSDSLSAGVKEKSTEATSYTYGGTPQVVWALSEADVPTDFADKTSKSTKYAGDAMVSGLKIAERHAMLVTYYVREKVKESSLHVYYVNGTSADKNNDGAIFHTGVINVMGDTKFKEGIALNQTNWKGKLVNSEVTNSAGNEQYITADLSEFYDVPASLRNVDYTCNDVETSDDLKTVWLYYSFGTDVSFVADFGTPMVIKPTDLNADLGTVKTVTITTNPTYGTATVDTTNNLTYTPSQSFAASANGDSFMVTVETKKKDESGQDTDETEKVSYNVRIYPASNVLYEEDFLTTEETRWTKVAAVDTAKVTDTQETQMTSDTGKNVFGYDGSYSASVGENGVWQMSKLDEKTNLGKPLTTTFYGNAFDLIGDCATDTGRVMMAIVNADTGDTVTSVIVDTRYTDGKNTTLHQVPLAHVVLDADATYRVDIYATKLAATDVTITTPNGAAAAALYSDEDASEDEALNEFLETYGLTASDVEYVTVANELADSEDGIATASLIPDSGSGSITVHHAAGTHVEIDGFRVYRSTDAEDAVAKNYPDNEKNVTYYNILDIGNGEGTIVAYSEANGNLSTTVEMYEAKGGPQNEIYLENGQAIYFKNAKLAGKTIQVSLRAVNSTATASVTGSEDIALATNTEMYYMVTADAEGQVVIANNNDGILAIGNVKMPAGYVNTDTTLASAQNSSAVNKAVQAALNGGETEVFTPETFTAKTTATTVIRNKVVTLKVNVSSDVAYITVNGVKYTRTGLTGLFRNTRTIRVVNTVKKDQTKTYEIIAYNADGVASETVTVTG